MTGLQPANRKLLDDATAAGLYRTAAQVDTQADARIAAARGASNGVASLVAGVVPAAQLPPSSTAARGLLAAATVAAGGSFASSAAITGLQLAATLDPTRAYEVQVTGLVSTVNSVATARALAGTTAPTSATGTAVGSAGSASGGVAVSVLGRFSVNTAGTYTLAFHVSGGSGFTGSSVVPAVASIADVGPKVTGLPAVP